MSARAKQTKAETYRSRRAPRVVVGGLAHLGLDLAVVHHKAGRRAGDVLEKVHVCGLALLCSGSHNRLGRLSRGGGEQKSVPNQFTGSSATKKKGGGGGGANIREKKKRRHKNTVAGRGRSALLKGTHVR